MAKNISIRQGSMTRRVQVEDNETVAGIRDKYGSRMELTGDHKAHMSVKNGNPIAANDETVVEEGAVLEFSRTTGQKG